jgi:hypothetical protein
VLEVLSKNSRSSRFIASDHRRNRLFFGNHPDAVAGRIHGRASAARNRHPSGPTIREDRNGSHPIWCHRADRRRAVGGL